MDNMENSIDWSKLNKETMEEKPLIATPTEKEGYYQITKEQIEARKISITTKEAEIMFDNVIADRFELVLGNDFEVKQEDGKWFVVKKQPQYPNTYKECCKVVGVNWGENQVDGYFGYLLYDFQRLLICRNAYWKVAGDWKPDFTDDKQERYGIYTAQNNITLEFYGGGDVNLILTFPTEEMRDAFYENFENLIEECKELL